MMASSSAAAEALGLAVGVVGQVAWHLHPTQSQRLSPWTQIPAQTPRARREALAPRAWIRSQNLAWSQAWIRAQAPGAYQPRAPAWARALAQVCTLVRARERVSMCWGVIHVGANKLALPLDVRSVASRISMTAACGSNEPKSNVGTVGGGSPALGSGGGGDSVGGGSGGLDIGSARGGGGGGGGGPGSWRLLPRDMVAMSMASPAISPPAPSPAPSPGRSPVTALAPSAVAGTQVGGSGGGGIGRDFQVAPRLMLWLRRWRRQRQQSQPRAHRQQRAREPLPTSTPISTPRGREVILSR